MAYRPQSPDLAGLVAEPSGGYLPTSPQLHAGVGEIPVIPPSTSFSHHHQQHFQLPHQQQQQQQQYQQQHHHHHQQQQQHQYHHNLLQNLHHQHQQQQQLLVGHPANDFSNYHPPVTSAPQTSPPYHHPQYQPAPPMPPSTRRKQVNYAEPNDDDDEFMPDAPAPKKSRRVKQELPDQFQNGQFEPILAPAPIKCEGTIKKEVNGDPTLGCQLKTSFPVARIKRIMQADEDIGKVAQVTPTVVSRALELFMIKLISAAAHEARGPEAANGTTKGPRRVLAQHLKRAIQADEQLDFLEELTSKVPDAPVKAKKEAASDSEDAKPKRKGKKRKDSGDDF